MWATKGFRQENGDHEAREDGASSIGAARSTRSAHSTPKPNNYDGRDEPNERTKLLDRPRPPNSDGYLDPDDPAVSLCLCSSVGRILMGQ